MNQGAKVTFVNLTPDGHTISILRESDLPTTFDQTFMCGAPGGPCFQFFAGHFPLGPDTPPDQIVFVLMLGLLGLMLPEIRFLRHLRVSRHQGLPPK